MPDIQLWNKKENIIANAIVQCIATPPPRVNSSIDDHIMAYINFFEHQVNLWYIEPKVKTCLKESYPQLDLSTVKFYKPGNSWQFLSDFIHEVAHKSKFEYATKAGLRNYCMDALSEANRLLKVDYQINQEKITELIEDCERIHDSAWPIKPKPTKSVRKGRI